MICHGIWIWRHRSDGDLQIWLGSLESECCIRHSYGSAWLCYCRKASLEVLQTYAMYAKMSNVEGWWSHSYLVGGFRHFLFSIIYGIILLIDFHIFQDGYCTTNQLWCRYPFGPVAIRRTWLWLGWIARLALQSCAKQVLVRASAVGLQHGWSDNGHRSGGGLF